MPGDHARVTTKHSIHGTIYNAITTKLVARAPTRGRIFIKVVISRWLWVMIHCKYDMENRVNKTIAPCFALDELLFREMFTLPGFPSMQLGRMFTNGDVEKLGKHYMEYNQTDIIYSVDEIFVKLI